jgi:hypothetical protein
MGLARSRNSKPVAQQAAEPPRYSEGTSQDIAQGCWCASAQAVFGSHFPGSIASDLGVTRKEARAEETMTRREVRKRFIAAFTVLVLLASIAVLLKVHLVPLVTLETNAWATP